MSNSFLKRHDKVVDKLPFAGRYTVQAVTKSYLRSNPKNETAKYAGTCLFLGGFASMHALQAAYGAATLASQLNVIETAPDVTNYSLLGIDILYTAAMSAVALRQARLTKNISRLHKHRRTRFNAPSEVPSSATIVNTKDKTARQPESSESPINGLGKSWLTRRKLGAIGASIVFTLGGQLAMSASSAATVKNLNTMLCVEDAHQSIDNANYENQHFSPDQYIDVEADKKSWAEFCGVDADTIS